MKQDLWQTLERFAEIRSPWVSLIGERLQDDQDRVLDYWRVEKADSVIIISIQNNRFLLPILSYRPGIGKATLDFPGGESPIGAKSFYHCTRDFATRVRNKAI